MIDTALNAGFHTKAHYTAVFKRQTVRGRDASSVARVGLQQRLGHARHGRVRPWRSKIDPGSAVAFIAPPGQHVGPVFRRARADEAPECASEVARVLEPRVQRRNQDAGSRILESLLGALNALQDNVSMRCEAGAVLEQSRKVVRAHRRNGGEVRHAEVVDQVVAHVVEHAPQPTARQAGSIA